MHLPLAQEFNKTAAAAYEAFSDELARLVVLTVPDSGTPVFISPQIANQLTKSTLAIRSAGERILYAMEDLAAMGYAERDFNLAGTPVNLIALLDGDSSDDIPADRRKQEMELIYTLDHEIGHHIVTNGFSLDINLAESAADAFAVLRHVQRFGKESGYTKDLCERMATRLILTGDSEHYTGAAIQRAMAVADERGDDFFNLPLRETAKLAAEIAADTQLDHARQKKISDAFQPVKALYERYAKRIIKFSSKKQRYKNIIQEVLSVMEKYRGDADVCGAAKQFLDTAEFTNTRASKPQRGMRP
jgi:hypothetical protein